MLEALPPAPGARRRLTCTARVVAAFDGKNAKWCLKEALMSPESVRTCDISHKKWADQTNARDGRSQEEQGRRTVGVERVSLFAQTPRSLFISRKATHLECPRGDPLHPARGTRARGLSGAPGAVGPARHPVGLGVRNLRCHVARPPARSAHGPESTRSTVRGVHPKPRGGGSTP